MPPAPLASPSEVYAADFARRFSLILAGLSALIARRFLRTPRLALLIVPLWRRLNRAARRCERLLAAFAAGRLKKPHRSGPGGPHRHPALPTGRLWLIRALGAEGAGYAAQLQHLLAEPLAARLFARVPALRRVVLPVARLLGVGAGTAPRSSAGSTPTAPGATALRPLAAIATPALA